MAIFSTTVRQITEMSQREKKAAVE